MACQIWTCLVNLDTENEGIRSQYSALMLEQRICYMSSTLVCVSNHRYLAGPALLFSMSMQYFVHVIASLSQ